MSDIKARIMTIPSFKKIRREDFLMTLGASYGNFTGRNRDTSIRSDLLEKILMKYPEINARWLITGEGVIDGVETREVCKNIVTDTNMVVISRNEYELMQELSKIALAKIDNIEKAGE